MGPLLKKNNSLLLRGALTNRPASFKSRPWELRSVYTLDVLDTLNNLVEVNIRGNDFIRILPVASKFTTTEGAWISDRIRYAVDAFRLQRLDNPLLVLKTGVNNKSSSFSITSWKILFKVIDSSFKFLKTSKLNAELFNINNTARFPFFYFFNKKGIPLSLTSHSLLEHLYDLLSVNSYFIFNSSTLNTTLMQMQSAARSVTVTTNKAPFCGVNLNNYSTIFVVGSELASVSPVIWSNINQLASTKNVEVFTFSDAQATKFSGLVSNFKHVGSLYDFKKLLNGCHWLSTKLHQCALAKKNQLIVIKVDSVSDIVLLNYINQLSSTSAGFRLNVFPIFTTNNLIHGLTSGHFGEVQGKLKNDFRLFSQQSLVCQKNPTNEFFYKKLVKRHENKINSPFSLHLSSHAASALVQSHAAVPISAFFEELVFLRDLVGNLKETKRVITAPGLSTEASNFLVLLYAVITQNYEKRDLFLSYLFSYVAKKSSLIKSRASKLSALKSLAKLLAEESLTLSSFLRVVLPLMYSSINPRVTINLNPSLFLDTRSVKSTIWISARLGSNGYLSFGDEITIHSKALLAIKKQLL